MQYMKKLVLNDNIQHPDISLIPTRVSPYNKEIDSVVYSSRKSFLRVETDSAAPPLKHIDDCAV